MSFKTEVCSCSSFLTDAVLWTKEVEMVESLYDLETSQSIGGRRFPKFEMLDVKIASVLKKIITDPYFKKRVSVEEQKAQMEDRFLSGRQIAHVIYEYFRVTDCVTRSTHTDLDVMQETRVDDYWNVDSNRSLSDSWKGAAKFTLLKDKPPKGYMWSEG